MLLKRFPALTDEELRKAHLMPTAVSLLQDMATIRSAAKFFSDLVHYVRSGDFVEALLRDSST